MIETISPPPIVRGACISQTKCFRIEPTHVKKAPPLVAKFRTDYYVNRMKMHVKNAQDPDMNMSLKEIRDGVKISDRMRLSLEVYGLGVLALMFLLGG